MFCYIQNWINQTDRKAKRSEIQIVNKNVIEAHRVICNYLNCSPPSKQNLLQGYDRNMNKNRNLSQQENEKLYIGLSSTSVFSKVKYLNMLLGKELFDEEFFSTNRGFLTISYNEKMRVNGQEFNTMKETLNYLKTQKSITQCIRLEFPISFHEQFPKEFRDKIVFLDKFIEIIQDLNQINFNYILLEKNTQLELDIWMSTQKAYSEYAIYLNNESRKILSDRKELLSIVCLIISSESYSDQLQLQNPLQNELTLLRKIQRNNNIENKSINQNQENSKSTNFNPEFRKTQNLRQNFDSSELSSNNYQNCFKAQLASLQNEKYFQCVPFAQFQIYNSENQNNIFFVYKGYQLFINDNNQSCVEAQTVKQEGDNIQKRICLDSIKTAQQVSDK